VDLIYAYRVPRKRRKPIPKQAGFSLPELIVVLAGLGILASLAIPNFIKYLQFAQIDEAKSLLNSAAAECLQLRRSDPMKWSEAQPEALKARTLPGSYQYKGNLKTCSEIEIYDPSSEDTLFPMLKFTIFENGRVLKESQFYNPDSEEDCKSWGNCGGSPSAKYLKQCFKDKTDCEIKAGSELKLAKDGPISSKGWSGNCTWPQSQCGCTRDLWACDGRLYDSQTEYETCRNLKLDKECKDHLKKLSESDYSGFDSIGACNSETWWWKGKEVPSREAVCTEEAVEMALTGNKGPIAFKVGTGCEAKWSCNSEIQNSEADYLAKCPTPPPQQTPPPPPCKMWFRGNCLIPG